MDDALDAVDRADLEERGKKWIERIRQQQKGARYEAWCKIAEEADAAYRIDRDSSHLNPRTFNMFHSNVETVCPAVFNSAPVPDVRPNVVDDGSGLFDVAENAAQVLEGGLAAQVDDNALDTEIEAATKDAYISGRGIVRVRFDADIVEREEADPFTGLPQVFEELADERVRYEVVPWRDYVEGPAKRFDEVPWVAYRLTVLKEDFGQFDQAYITAQQLEDKEPDEPDECSVWEIWDKASGTVLFVRDSNSMLLMEQPDPLGLAGFFPSPKPIEPLSVAGSRVPIAPYAAQRALIEEIDVLSARITKIAKGLKVKAMAAGALGDLAKLAEADDWELTVVDNIESFMATGGVEKALAWWPIEQAIVALRELYAAREQAKQALYEVSGLSDIIRGASKSSETATAQQIKTQWGALRVNKFQKQVERHARDLFVLTAEIMVNQFSDRRLAELAGVQVEPQALRLLRQGLKQYVIDVESDSTVRGDLTRKKGEMGEFLQATSAYFQTMAPIVQQGGPQLAAPVVSLFASFARMFSLGKQGEAALDQMIEMAKQAADAPPQPNPQQEAMKAEMQMKAQKQEADIGLAQGKQALDAQRLQFEVQKFAAQHGLNQEKLTGDQFAKAAEIEMETEQQRAVRFGDG